MQENKRLVKSSDHWIAGVCGGIADYFSLDKELVRLAWLILSLVTVAFPGIIAYIALWIIMPQK